VAQGLPIPRQTPHGSLANFVPLFMADASFSVALDFVLEVLSSRHRAGMGTTAATRALNALMAVPAAVSAEEGGGGRPSTSPPRAAVAPLAEVSAGAPQALESFSGAQPKLVSQPGTGLLPAPILDVGEGTPVQRLELLRAGALVCQKCPALAAARAQVVFGQGNVEAALMLVGEAPGAEEDQEGRPFAGEAGELLEKMLKAMGLSIGEVYATSVLKCHPFVPGEPGAVRPPQADELERCLPYLAAQISIVRPRVIVAMGAGAMHALFGGRTPMGSLRSRWHEVQGIPVMPTFHPRYLLRNDDVRERRKVWEDLMQVMERLGLEVTARHRSFFLKGA
jgi:uracil-DNA glycosylase family 4